MREVAGAGHDNRGGSPGLFTRHDRQLLVQPPGNVLLLLGAVAVTRDKTVFLDIKVALDVDRRVDQRLQLAAGDPGALDPDHVKAGWHVDRAGPAVLDQAGGRKCTASPRHRGCSTFSAIAAPQSKHAWVQAMSSACTAAGRDCLLQALDQDGLASTAPPVNRDHARATLHLRRHLAQPPEHAVQQLHLPAAGFDLTRVQPHLSLAVRTLAASVSVTRRWTAHLCRRTPMRISQRDVAEGRAVVARSMCLGLQQPV